MVVDDVREADPPVQERGDGPRPKVFLGSYPAFLGVRYFVLLDEEEVARGATKIGPVGWTRTTRSRIEEAIRLSRN